MARIGQYNRSKGMKRHLGLICSCQSTKYYQYFKNQKYYIQKSYKIQIHLRFEEMTQSKKQDYHILSLIGKGAYGDVYKARKKFTGQIVAIKTIKKKGKQQKDLKSMRQEIQILKKLKHQNIVLLLDSFQTSSELILVTELGQGQLFNLIEDDQYIEQVEIRKIAQQLVRALYYIHSNRITHRDMKPQNILMTSDGTIKLCDFGFARRMSYNTEVLTSLKGTPLYMAPQVVKEEPYNHTADLWSLGVILYELSTGNPPFTAPNLLKLVEHISKDPIIYPDTIQGDFKSFLKGLLNKDPQQRLGWPQLLSHPFIKQTETEKFQRKKKNQQYNHWIEDNHINNQNANSNNNNATYDRAGRVSSRLLFQVPGKQTSPKKQKCNDSTWNGYIAMVGEERGPNQLRSDPNFLDNLLTVLSINFNELMRVKEKKSLLQTAIKVLVQVLMKSKPPDSKKMDITKNLNIPNHLLNILKSLLKFEGGKTSIQLISDITKTIGLIAKITFNKNIGIQMIYLRSFLPLLQMLAHTCLNQTDQQHQTLTVNLLRTTGIFANNASANHIRSFSFYRDIVEVRFVQQCMEIIKHYEQHINVLKIVVQVFSAFMHPVYGDIECFPWKRDNNDGIVQFKECITMLECVRQSIINCLFENQGQWMQVFNKILELDDESALLPKISIQRILLQSLRQSKEFSEYLLFNCTNGSNSKNLLKPLFQILVQGSDPIVYGTTCIIIGQLTKSARQRKKQRLLETYLTQSITGILYHYSEFGKSMHQNQNNALGVYGIFVLLQELINIQTTSSSSSMSSGYGSTNGFTPSNLQTIQSGVNNAVLVANSNSPSIGSSLYYDKIIEKFGREDSIRILIDYLSNPHQNKLEEMRKLEGSNYGVHLVGFYDSCIVFIQRIMQKMTKDSDPFLSDFTRLLTHFRIQNKISHMITTLSSRTDISPKGLISLLMLIYSLSANKLCKEFMNDSFVKCLIGLLKESQIESLLQWPSSFGGGQTCAQILFGNLMKIFLIYLQEAEKQPEVVKVFYNENLVEPIVSFAKNLNNETISSVVTFLVHLLSFDKPQRSFVKQFIQASGMALFVRFDLLKGKEKSGSQNDSNSLLEAINLLSQIARSSKQAYENIASIQPYEDIRRLIKHPDKNIKSRLLNLIGNMCRHSSYFYQKLRQNHDILQQSIKLCSDNDKVTKKFACVVLGNASFHDDTLYASLAPSVQVLVGLLKENDQKTRSNAAAALGNLARNSELLDREFVKCGANHQLINMLINDKSISAKKVSAMAISNLLGLKQSRELLMELKIKQILSKFVPPTYNGDQSLIKTIQKALQKTN